MPKGKGKGYDIVCPGCAESYHETTETYDPDVDANAGMLKLKDQYKSYGWDEPPPDPTCGYGVLECPECEAPLAPSGRFKVRVKEITMAEGATITIDQTKSLDEFKQDKTLGEEPIVITSDEKLASVAVDGKGEIKAFICAVCQREFKSKANIANHMRVHKK